MIAGRSIWNGLWFYASMLLCYGQALAYSTLSYITVRNKHTLVLHILTASFK